MSVGIQTLDVPNSTNVRSFYKAGPKWLTTTFGWGSRVAPELTSAVAARLFLTTRRGVPKEGERTILAQADAFHVGKMAAWSWGAGPTVLLVHGWNGRATQLGGFVAPLVERGYRVVAFDALGHGQSPGNRLSLPELADCIHEVADEIGDVYGVVAHSMGGAATTLAMADGLKIERAVFISPPSDPQVFIDFFSRSIGVSERVARRAQERVEARVGRRMRDLRVDEIAKRMHAPVLVIHDQNDAHVPLRFGRSVAEAWPGARFETTQGLGHRRILRAEHVKDLTVGFIDAQERIESTAA